MTRSNRISWRGALAVAVGLSSSLVPAHRASAHGEAIGTAKGGPATRVVLDAAARASIGLVAAEADFRSIDEVVGCTGSVKPKPNAVGVVSTRVEGRVLRFHANVGDRVNAGQAMVEIETRQVGNPPPVISVSTPIGGVVVHRDVELGEAIEPGKHLMHVMDLARVQVQCEVFESDVARIAVGQDARVRFVAYPGRSWTGGLVHIAPTLDPETRTVQASLELDNRDGVIKPEMFASASIVVRHSESVLTAPRAALLVEGGETFVYVVEGDALVRKDISTGAQDDQFVEIKDGLVPGDEVVTDGKREVHTKALMGGGGAADDD